MRLLDDRLIPITLELGLIEVPCAEVAKWLLDFESSVQAKRGGAAHRKDVSGNLELMLLQLLPLTSVEARRYLLLPTTAGWTAYFDNGWRGSDASSLSHTARELQCRAIRVASIPEAKGSSGKVTRYGARIFELYGPERTYFLNYVRTISVANDGGRWRFDQGGTPLPHEDASWFSARTIKDRFSHEHLVALLRGMGLAPFDASFYESKGVMIERSGPTAVGYEEYQLADLRSD